MGYAFLPIAIGYFIAGPLGGYLVSHFGKTASPQHMWWVIAGIGFLSTALMILYDRIVKPSSDRLLHPSRQISLTFRRVVTVHQHGSPRVPAV